MSVRIAARHRNVGKPKENLLSRLLDPIDLLSEAIFSLLIVLIYTVAFGDVLIDLGSAARPPERYVRDLMIGAASAVLAWGVIDGIMYALMSMFERGEHNRLRQQLQVADCEENAIEAIAQDFDYLLDPIASENTRRLLYQDIAKRLRNSDPEPVRLSREDILGGVGSVLIAMISVMPSLMPLLLFQQNPPLAIRLSILVSFLALLVAGVLWGRYVGSNSVRFGLLLVSVSAVMVLLVLLLGG